MAYIKNPTFKTLQEANVLSQINAPLYTLSILTIEFT